MTDIALALVDLRHVEALAALPALTVADCGAALGWRHAPFDGALADHTITRLHIGPDCCERLLPSRALLEAALAFAAGSGLGVSLASPLMADAALERLRALLHLLPAGAEAVANDWGTLHLLAVEFPALVPVAGRMLCKMVKDPRLPAAEWARLYPHGIHAAPFGAVLARLGVRRIEMDAPPFATAADFAGGRLPVGVHAPFGIATKGRTCRIGALHQIDAAKFAPSFGCARECLSYTAALERPHATTDLETRMRGTAMLYRHSPAMAAAVLDAAGAGTIDRIILSGDWH